MKLGRLATAAAASYNAPMPDDAAPDLLVRHLEHPDYEPCWHAMQRFTADRAADTVDELWVLEHPPVFTLGQAGRREHLLDPGPIPVVQCDRGGQVTYHGPGQTVIYLLVDIARLGIGARELVSRIEGALVDTLAHFGIDAAPDPGAPGVYVSGAKIASLGLRIRQGRSYHGLALNRDLDLSAFHRINPCGHAGQPMTSLALLGINAERETVERQLLERLRSRFGWQAVQHTEAFPDCYNAPPCPEPEAS